jgi:DNA replication protein DnaC
MTEDEIIQRAQERLDRIRAEAPKPAVRVAATAAALHALRGVPVMTEAECAALRERQERYREQLLADTRVRALTASAESLWLAQCGASVRHCQLEQREDLVPADVRWWADRAPAGASAILCGPTGSGKTAAAVWALRTLYRSGSAESDGWKCPSAAFVSASELFSRVFEKQPLTRFERVDLLVIDDWGMAYETDWPLSTLDRLIDRRWSELRSTIATTNLTPDQFAERYPRIHSRLCDSAGPGFVVLNRGDLRRVKA